MRRRKGSRKRAIEKMEDAENYDAEQDARVPVSYPGSCTMEVCKGETACRPQNNNTYTCLCTHDSLPPTARGICPRRIVNEAPGRIPNVQPPSIKLHPATQTTTNSTTPSEDQPAAATTEFQHLESYIVPSVFTIVLSLVIVFSLTICLKRRSKRHNAVASPINLKHSLLVAERYAPNPQYSACSGTGVPVLRKETLKFLNEVGEGCFGKVFKGELLSEDTDQIEIVAIKVLKDSATREAEEDFLREVEIMSAFRHPNILSLLGVVLRDGNINPMMVFEFMPHGDLAELLRSQRKSTDNLDEDQDVPQLTRRDLLSISLQIGSGMKYLAAQRFVHRDLACRNCLVAEGPTVKIADFGMSRDVYTCDYYKIGGSRLLPVRWMSPESVVYGRFTLESDIWSYGVVLWEIYSYGKQPYYGHTNEEVVKLILDGIMLIPPEDCPSLICELMKNCWKTEPRHRITFPNICDKLELAFEGFDEKSELKYENEMKKFKQMGSKNKSLPRPPPLPVLTQADLLDAQGYLLPKEVKEPVHYLETLPD
ncbi:tyrosine-protein kinase transmembrane receptor Ror isoform X2 [Anoplophora glabripennis]|uniref:tyrosine-protein kinase transmembrane receptor Ror isoform X2 n=1 Tax=Anoplophora glabripennis TaxID=217634 RepID=UPI00087499F2|nr:tyrosine-protein kinase transmembrane receptor Ror isoform X2 [Anoplophora glabripennis]